MSKSKSSIGSKTRSTRSEDDNGTSAAESTACLLSPPPTNISIGHMYVYNFSPDSASIEIPITKAVNKIHSPATSSGPFCRICHEGDCNEDLISPCHCAGTVGLVHLTCMERWLSLAGSDRCEICNFIFSTIRSPRSFIDWIRSNGSDSESRRSLVSDLLCFFLLTPLAGVSSYLCVEGSRKQVNEGNSLEAGCLMALATFLITIYFIWNLLTFRFYLRTFFKWRSKNQRVTVVHVKRFSSPDVLRTISVNSSATRSDVVIRLDGSDDIQQDNASNVAPETVPLNSEHEGTT